MDVVWIGNGDRCYLSLLRVDGGVLNAFWIDQSARHTDQGLMRLARQVR